MLGCVVAVLGCVCGVCMCVAGYAYEEDMGCHALSLPAILFESGCLHEHGA